MKKECIRKARGVTMLALVVTIIVLLILAVITLSLAVGENGIIKRAKLARDKAKNASIAEEEAMNLAADEIDNAESGGSGGSGEDGTCPECPDVSELEKTIKELQNTIASLEQQLATEKANKAELEKQIADLNKQITQLSNELNSKKEQIADLQGQVSSKNQELARKDETIKNLESTVASLNSQIEELNRQVETLKAKQATGNAAVSEVLTGKTFSNSNGVGLVGTMVNIGAINATLNAGQSYNILEGYTTGGRVTAASLESQTEGTANSNNLSAGKTAWVNGQQIIGNGADSNTAYNNGYNAGLSQGSKNLTWKYTEITALPTKNSSVMSWDLTSIPNYDSLELYKTLNPVMVSTFDMDNWDTNHDRAWKVEWRYNQSAGILTIEVKSDRGPMVQYGAGQTSRTIGIYYLVL